MVAADMNGLEMIADPIQNKWNGTMMRHRLH